MVRFILSNANSTLANGIYTFSLDQRLPNASFLQLKKANFQLTTTDVAPLCVYIRSSALHDLCSEKHTVELKGQNHQSSSDILGILEETHVTGRYRLRSFNRGIPLKYSHLRTIDIYFTNPAGTNVLGIGSDASDVPTAAQIASRTDLWLFVNFLDTTKITLPTAGTLTEVIAVNDNEFDFDTTNGTAVVYEDFGSNSGKCVRFNNDWIRLTDASNVPNAEPATGTFCILFTSQSTQDDYCIFDFARFTAYSNDGIVTLTGGTSLEDTTMALENTTDYLLTMRRDGAQADAAVGGMIWRLEKLSNGTLQTYHGKHHGRVAMNTSYEFGHSSVSALTSRVANVVVISSIADSDVEAIEMYLRDYHTAQADVTKTEDVYTQMIDNMSTPTDQLKKGRIFRAFDTGGSGSNYTDNESINRIYETPGGNWKIKFLIFTTESSYDKLRIYNIDNDGTETAITEELSGSLPATVDYTSTDKKIKFVWVSDGSSNNIGFDILLYEDADGKNTLTEDSGDYTLSVPRNGEVAANTGSWCAEMDINTS